MSKRLCKFDRREIASQMGVIAKLVAAPQYVCRSCARVAADNKSLCKAMPLPKSVSQTVPHAVNVMDKSKKSLKKQKKISKKLAKLVKKQHKLQDKLAKLHRD